MCQQGGLRRIWKSMPSLIQCNLNRSWGAQDLLAQYVREEEIGICAISEPRRVPDSKKWCKSLNGLAAVMWEPRILGRPGIMVGRGENFVTAKFGDFKVISCYISPNVDMGVFLEFLDELGEEVRRLDNRETIICGGFNSKSILWGAPRTNRRGELVEEWAAEMDVRLMNTGQEPTCIRAQGESYIDLTWITPDMVEKITNWRVVQKETLSDHVYINMEIGSDRKRVGNNNKKLGWN